MSRTAAGLIGVALLFAADPAGALPRFAARNGARCSLCHVNPSGGGMRNAYGREVFERFQLPLLGPNPGDWAPGGVAPAISESVALGADIRTAFFQTVPRDKDKDRVPEQSTFFQMQADLYVGAQMGRYASAYLDKGTTGSLETWVMVQVPEWLGLYLRAGRFMPNFGLKFANHTALTREEIGLGPQEKDVGVELGFSPGPVTLSFSAFNGELGSVLLDGNTEKGLMAKLEHAFRTPGFTGMFGLSWSRNQTGDRDHGDAARQSRYGGYLGLSLGRFTWLGEAVALLEEDGAGDAEPWKLVTYQELSFNAVRGLDLMAIVDTRDPDLERETGHLVRVGGSFEFFPVPMLELKLLYRHTFAEGDPLDGLQEVIAYVHGFF